ncbi:MAG: ABC transporter ATP-binding protein [Thermotogae bacterium]|nr:ABC transporter ATP-binding protein [Thermotogota bacterium]
MPIKLKNLTKKFGDYTAVNNITLSIEDSKITVLIGPSGCGKTTTLKMINGLIKRTEGNIFFNEISIDKINPIDLRRRIGYVIQEIGLFPHMNVYQNIAVVPKLLGWKENKIKNRINELLELVNLNPEENIFKYPKQLSGGQKQRVGVARALAADPEILLMDEPFGAIDPINREKLQDAFIDIQEKIKKTIVFVTHDIREAIKLGDSISVFNTGKIEQSGKTFEIIKKPKNKFVSNLIGNHAEINTLEFRKAENSIDKDFSAVKINASDTNLLKEQKNSYVIFLDDNNNFLGILSKEKISQLSTENYLNNLKTYFITPDSTLLDAAGIMLSKGINTVPVISAEKKVLGVIKYETIFQEE